MLGRAFFTVICGILIVPFVLMVFLSFGGGENGFSEIFARVRMHELSVILWRSLIVSLVATLLAYPVSLILMKRSSTAFQSFFHILITLPFLLNESVRVFSWQYLLAENGLFNQVLGFCLNRPVHFFNATNSADVYAIMILSCVPFGIFICSAAIRTLPRLYDTVAGDLGLPATARFFRVTLPLTRQAQFSTLIVTFFIAFSLSAEVNYLGGATQVSIRDLVSSLLSASKFRAVFALGTMLTFFLIVLMVIFRRVIFKPPHR